MVPPAKFTLSVVYAMPSVQTEVALWVSPGTTVSQAIELSGILQRHPDISAQLVCGIFGQVVSGEHVLMPGDRVEIYRPLPADPKETRRELAKRGRTMARTQVKSRSV
jgi:hypothetical protein